MMSNKLKKILIFCAALSCMSLALAAEPEKKMDAAQFLGSLKFQEGNIELPGGVAELKLSPSFRYLAPGDAERLLVEGWSNPPGSKTLGMILPVGVSPLSDKGWGVIVTYDKDGHVKDDDADSIKYDDLLKEMQEAVSASNEERKKEGYPSMALLGWAEKPRYDKQTHKLYWAKELSVNGASEHTLNYNIRVLGRHGVLVLNAVAGMSQISEVKTEMQGVVGFSDFTAGNKYADFDGKTDKVAEYGIAALVAGGLAAKFGLFGKLFALLLVFKKFVLIGLALIGTSVMKLFGRKKKINLEK